MSADNIENEIKLFVPDLAALIPRLAAIGATLAKPRVFERNVRYENAQKTLTGAGIVIRLRQDTETRLTYKGLPGIASHDGIRSRFEVEVEVSDFDKMELILDRLGYYPHVAYEKWRTTYVLDDVEVVLDELPYGNFIEIEGPPDDIRQVVRLLGLQDAPSYVTSYLVLFDCVKQALKLDFNDLTFENFRNIDVPESILIGLA